MKIQSEVLKTVSYALIIMVCIAIAVEVIYIKILSPSPISKQDMEVEFIKHKETIISIANYLEKQNYYKIYITSNDKEGEMFVSLNDYEVGKYTTISDATVSEDVRMLFKEYNYNVIRKNDDEIYFQRWSNKDYGRGVVYSLSGEKPKDDAIISIEPLDEKNWFFYEEK